MAIQRNACRRFSSLWGAFRAHSKKPPPCAVLHCSLDVLTFGLMPFPEFDGEGGRLKLRGTLLARSAVVAIFSRFVMLQIEGNLRTVRGVPKIRSVAKPPCGTHPRCCSDVVAPTDWSDKGLSFSMVHIV